MYKPLAHTCMDPATCAVHVRAFPPLQFLITCTMKISGRYLVTLRAMCVTSEGRHTGAVPGMFFLMFVPILCFRLPKDWCCLGNAPGPHFQPLGQKMQETSSRSLVGTAPYVCAPDVTPDQSSQASIFTYSNPRLKAREQLMHSFSLKFPWLHSEPTC